MYLLRSCSQLEEEDGDKVEVELRMNKLYSESSLIM